MWESTDTVIRDRPAVRLTETGIAVYRYAARRGRITARAAASDLGLEPHVAARACTDLLSLRLLVEGPAQVFAPVHPDLARILWTEPLAGEIEERRLAIALQEEQFHRVSQILAGAAPAADSGGFRTVDPEELPAQIEAALLSCRHEVVSTHPGAPGRDGYPDGSVDPDVALLRRGVARRLLYQHTARANLGMPPYVSRLAGYGGQVRTTPEGLERMLIVDRRTAFVPLEPPGTEGGSVVTTYRPVVEFLHRGFERLWSGALPFEADAAQYDEVSTDIKASVLRLMAAGLKDDAIAHRLGIATRTCRRHISQIMDELNATSRFQAGVKLAQLRLLPIGEEAVPRPEADTYPWW